MTIVAGFKSYEGIVLCADTQETVGFSKRNVPKLRFEPNDKADKGVPKDDLAVAFCGATNNGAFMDEMVDLAWEEVQNATSLDEASDLIRRSIKSYHAEATKNYQVGHLPDTELIYGIKMFGDSRLFYSLGPAVTRRDQYATGGIGAYMADFLASRMYKDYLPLRQCLILAVYSLFQAKEHVEGCGGNSHIAILRNEGTSGRIDWHRVEALTELLKYADETTGELLLDVADLQTTDEKFRESVGVVIDVLEAHRHTKRRDIQDHANMLRTFFGEIQEGAEDEYGFPKQSEPETPEGQQ